MAEEDLQKIYESAYMCKGEYVKKLMQIMDESDMSDELWEIVRFVESKVKICLKNENFKQCFLELSDK